MYITGPAAPWTLEYFRLTPVEVVQGYRRCTHEQDGFQCRNTFKADGHRAKCNQHRGYNLGKPPRICEICDMPTPSRRHRWCSDHLTLHRECPVCDEEYTTERNRPKHYCSFECAQAGKRQAQSFAMRSWR